MGYALTIFGYFCPVEHFENLANFNNMVLSQLVSIKAPWSSLRSISVFLPKYITIQVSINMSRLTSLGFQILPGVGYLTDDQ